LTFASSLEINAVSPGIVNLIFLILLLLSSDPERSVNDSSRFFESSGYQCQHGINHAQQLLHMSTLGDIQMLLHILQAVKDRISAQNSVCSF
jgi:hypothetical protein